MVSPAKWQLLLLRTHVGDIMALQDIHSQQLLSTKHLLCAKYDTKHFTGIALV